MNISSQPGSTSLSTRFEMPAERVTQGRLSASPTTAPLSPRSARRHPRRCRRLRVHGGPAIAARSHDDAVEQARPVPPRRACPQRIYSKHPAFPQAPAWRPLVAAETEFHRTMPEYACWYGVPPIGARLVSALRLPRRLPRVHLRPCPGVPRLPPRRPPLISCHRRQLFHLRHRPRHLRRYHHGLPRSPGSKRTRHGELDAFAVF